MSAPVKGRSGGAARLRGEDGVTLTELLVSMLIGSSVIMMVFTLITLTTNGSARVTSRVEADQSARLAMNRVIDRLHSTCITTGTTPIEPGSSGTAVGFLYQTGDAVTLTPELHWISFSAGPATLTERSYPWTGGDSDENWTFGTTASSTVLVKDGISTARLGSPAPTVPVFRYYGYDSATGNIQTIPLAVPLSAIDADEVVKVEVAFAASSTTSPVVSGGVAESVPVLDSAFLRVSPSAGSGLENAPCT